MKSITKTLGLLIISTLTIHCSFAQWSADTNSIWNTNADKNVGIGTSIPKEKLDVMGGIRSIRDVNEGGYISLSNSLKTDPAVASTWSIYNMTGGYGSSLQFWGYSNTATLGPKLVIKDDGKVGIGTTNPDAILHVTGGALMSKGWNRTAVLEATYPVLVFNSNNKKWAGIGYDYTSNFNIWYNASSNDVSNGMIALSVNNASGYVGIGTTAPTEKLTVNGNVKAKKMIVTQSGWADYVFDRDYNLMHLDSLSTYIKTNKHLPEIPTTKQIENEGVDVGTNQALLLKKIEELTLYIIEQHKQIAKQNKEMIQQNQRIKKLENERMAK